jgi:hypothetical protein
MSMYNYGNDLYYCGSRLRFMHEGQEVSPGAVSTRKDHLPRHDASFGPDLSENMAASCRTLKTKCAS